MTSRFAPAARLCLAGAALALAACGSDPVAPERRMPVFMVEGGDTEEPVDACDATGAPAAPERLGTRAMDRALRWVYAIPGQRDAYCGCPYSAAFDLDTRDCGYRQASDPDPRLGWDLVVPVASFGVYRDCWTHPDAGDDPAAYCAAHDEEFRAMQADLYNLLPAAAGLVERRAGNPLGMVQGEPRRFGSCDFELQNMMGKYELVEPPPTARGDIARAYFYMAWRYGKGKDWKVRLNHNLRKLLTDWDKADPVDDAERIRACRIKAVQGWENPFIE